MNDMKRIGAVLVFLLVSTTVVFSQEWAVSTNLVGYLNLGTLNVEASYAPLRHMSIHASAKYNPFTFHSPNGTQFQERQQSYAVGLRWWPWHIQSGWWVAAKLQYQEYNIGGITSSRTEEGDRAGLGLTAGYTYMLHQHINLEFGIGGWAGYKWYTAYSCPKCGMTTDEGGKPFVLPNDLIVSIVYVF